MDNLTAGDLTIEVEEADGALRCTWLGKSNDRAPGKVLAPFFDALLAEAKAGDAAVEMHFEKLDHFNSSTITAIIRLIQTARAKQVKLVIAYDSELKWQRLSFDALRVFEKADKLFVLEAVS